MTTSDVHGKGDKTRQPSMHFPFVYKPTVIAIADHSIDLQTIAAPPSFFEGRAVIVQVEKGDSPTNLQTCFQGDIWPVHGTYVAVRQGCCNGTGWSGLPVGAVHSLKA